MTTVDRLAKSETSQGISLQTAGESVLESFHASEAIITEKFNALSKKKDDCEEAIRKVQGRINKWDGLIEQAGYGREHLSENANRAIDKLTKQATTYLLATVKELQMYQKVLDSILTHLSAIEEMVIRLKNSEYEIKLNETFKGMKMMDEGFESPEDISLSLQELERDIKRLEYTSEALLELGEVK
jgi:prefoldin subunit 5